MVISRISKVIRFVWLHLLMLSLVCMNCQITYADSTVVTSGSSVISHVQGQEVFIMMAGMLLQEVVSK